LRWKYVDEPNNSDFKVIVNTEKKYSYYNKNKINETEAQTNKIRFFILAIMNEKNVKIFFEIELWQNVKKCRIKKTNVIIRREDSFIT